MANTLYKMTPKEIVAELDKYIIGQDEAKKSMEENTFHKDTFVNLS